VCVPAQYVETLQEQLSDLQDETGTKRCARLPQKVQLSSAYASCQCWLCCEPAQVMYDVLRSCTAAGQSGVRLCTHWIRLCQPARPNNACVSVVQSSTCPCSLASVRLSRCKRSSLTRAFLHARVDREVLALYRQRVAELVPRVQPPHVPAYCAGLPAHSRGVVGGAAPSAQPPPAPPLQTEEARSDVKPLLALVLCRLLLPVGRSHSASCELAQPSATPSFVTLPQPLLPPELLRHRPHFAHARLLPYLFKAEVTLCTADLSGPVADTLGLQQTLFI
jgi:hypothetical protein